MPGGAPHVVGAVFVAGIVGRKLLGHDRPRVGEIGQLRLVELQKHLGHDLALQEIAGGNDDVVAGLAGEQPRLQRLVGVKGVVDHLDAGLLGEVLQHAGRHVVRPVVEVDHALLRPAREPTHTSVAAAAPAKAILHIRIIFSPFADAPHPQGAPAPYRAWHPSWRSRTAPPMSPHPVRRTPTPG